MNRGSDISAAPHFRSATGFNEAPIHESGKSEGLTGSRQRQSSFNEAPIHESGKYVPGRSHILIHAGLQ